MIIYLIKKRGVNETSSLTLYLNYTLFLGNTDSTNYIL